MSLLSIIRKAPKRFAVLAALVVAGTATAFAFAWGPSRDTFTIQSPATYITFNSITNNPAYGDERNFMRVKLASASDSTYSDNTKIEAGKEYEVYIYYHNNAAANLNLVAKDTTVKMQLPAVVSGDTKSVAYISASNANPVEVWDDTTLTSDESLFVNMVPGSAKIYSHGAVDGKTIPDSIVGNGALLGYNALDGKLPGCEQYAGYVTYRFKASKPSFTLTKEVSKHAADKWVESYAAQPGEVVDYLIEYKNTGSVVQKDVVVKDTLPAGMTYVTGSTILGNPSNPGGVKTNDTVTTSGLNVGTYNPGQNAWIIFSAKVANSDKLSVCGVNTLKNIAKVETDYGDKTDDAIVTVTKECEESKTIEVCRLEDNVYPVTIKESEFDDKLYSKNPADCKEEETPEEIPSTGPAALITSIFGSSALGYGAYSYAASRRALKNIRK